jgi:phosphatidylserine decarboxylase
VAREGLPFILFPLGTGLAALVAGGYWLAAILLPVGLFSFWFFRDPIRYAPPIPNAVVSPADGTVIRVEEVDDDRFLFSRRKKISIFMSLVNVHVNRAPVEGTVESIQYFPGRFWAADLDKASKENEHNAVIVQAEGGHRVAFVQIAGLVARRIACWIRPGDPLTRGQRIGLIRFGSRLDVYLPVSAHVQVTIGRTVRAGESILGYLSEEDETKGGQGT